MRPDAFFRSRNVLAKDEASLRDDAAKLGDAVFAAQAVKDDADIFLGREVPPGGMSRTVSSALCGACLPRCLIASPLGLR